MEQAIWIFSDDKKEMQIFDFFFDCDETTKGEGGAGFNQTELAAVSGC